jgi:hypothetical protein
VSYSVSEESYRENDLSISEYLVEIDDDIAEIRDVIGDDVESDAVVLVQAVAGEFEAVYDFDLKERDTPREQDAFFEGSLDGQTSIYMRFVSRGYARVRVTIARIRKSLARVGRKLPCKLCKLAISLILRTFLVALGIPPLPSGDFNLAGYAAQLDQFFDDVRNGLFGAAINSIQSILPNKWWLAILSILQVLNWIFDATDAFYQDVCHALTLCPARPLPSNP